jgi:hypothetical protein
MLNRLRQIVASLANNPALLQLLRDDPQSFARQIGFSEPEMQALNGAGVVVGQWAARLAELARSSIAAKQFVPENAAPESVEIPRNPGGNGSSGDSGVPIVAVLATLGLAAAISTVSVVALSKADENS